jgi:hypothetical protein
VVYGRRIVSKILKFHVMVEVFRRITTHPTG